MHGVGLLRVDQQGVRPSKHIEVIEIDETHAGAEGVQQVEEPSANQLTAAD